MLKLRFCTFSALILAAFLSFSAVQADNSSDSSAFVCLQKVQKNIVLNNYIQVTDNKNYSYSGYFKGIDYEQNKITFLRNEPGIDAIMKSMQFDDISQIIVQKKKLNKANMWRWAVGGIFAFIGLISGGKVTVSQTITCEK